MAMKEKVRLRVSVAALFVDAGDVLLLHQMTPPEPDCWDLPGGGIEPHESLNDGLRRKVQKETGLINCLLTVTELFMTKDDGEQLHSINILYQYTVPYRPDTLTSRQKIGS